MGPALCHMAGWSCGRGTSYRAKGQNYIFRGQYMPYAPPTLFSGLGSCIFSFCCCFGFVLVGWLWLFPPHSISGVTVGPPRWGGWTPQCAPPRRASPASPPGGLCLLGAYADSDDEDGETPEKSARLADANGSSSADIDSTLANFLAEIDAITAPAQPAEPPAASSSAPPPTPPRPEPKESGSGPSSGPANGTGSAPAPEWQYDTQCSLAGVGELEMGDWQEVWDENTGCYYYWNTQSNEVTWELPPYLATQVQGLQHYQHSSTVAAANGSFVTTAELYPQEKGTGPGSVGRGATLAKREVKKEVNEGVQALSNSEEEKKGVAAALLAPLLPDVVKEEEERWRRKVICKEEVEPPAEEEAKAEEAAAAPEEPEANRDPLEDTQEDLCSVVQSGESAEEEEEQDTLELEMVLERKKAELRALEEGDGSVSGSSPLSDGSQSASQDAARRLASKRGKWKLFVGAASPESASRGSSKTGRESPEAGDAAPSAEAADAHSDKEAESEEPQEKTKPQEAPKIEEEEQDLKFQIGELANTLTNKLEFLGINRQSISNFHMLLLQTETRIADWREGALNGNYLKRKLQDAAEQLKQYEINATPKGWSCHWDRISGSTLLTNSSDKGQTSSHRRNEEQDFCLLPAGSIDAISMLTSARESRNGNSPTGRRTKRKDSEAPTEKPTVLLNHLQKTKESAPGTPPSTPQAPFVKNPSQAKPPLRLSCHAPLKSLVRPAASSTPVAAEPSPMPLLSAKPQKRKAADMNPGLMQRTATILVASACRAPSPPFSSPPAVVFLAQGKKGKTKMPSLVKKWQSIQRELDEEENSSSSEEDRETTAQRRIEEWKQQQLMSGMAERNANFEALPEDWRARLKRRKTASST
nr:formin-binding protein 4 [Columba livia]